MTAVTLEVTDGVAVLTLDLPGESVNKFTPSVIEEFRALLARIESDQAIEVVRDEGNRVVVKRHQQLPPGGT